MQTAIAVDDVLREKRVVDAILRYPIMYKYRGVERVKNEIAVTSKMKVHNRRLFITPYFIIVSNVV